jgi:membrane protease YdiL (CAAX protease family)
VSRAGAAGGAGASSKKSSSSARTPSGYFQRSELPLTSLAFLLPLVVLYEMGTRAWVTDPVHQTEQRIIAFNLMARFFELFGATGKYLPCLAVVGILLAWHVARRDKWHVKPAHVGGMALESVILALPLIVLGRVAEGYLSQVTLAGTDMLDRLGHAKGLLVLSIGAGVYEELVFRLITFTVLSFVLADLLEMNKTAASLLIVVIAGLLFSGYHYLGNEPFRWWTFAFRAVAGMYFGAVFLCRGFGITAGCHAGYDLVIVGLRVVG